MITLGFLADTHLGFDYPRNPRIQRRRRGHDFQKNYLTALAELEAAGVDAIIHGGDVFFRSRVSDEVQAMAYEPLLPLAEAGFPVLLVPGNHERSVLPPNPLFKHPNVFLFDRPRSVVLELQGYEVAFGGFPFVRHQVGYSWNRWVAETEILQTRADLKVLCVHHSFHGARVGPVDFMFRKGADVVGLDQIPAEIPLVLSGHIHRRQILKGQNGSQVIYPGSIERTSFAEERETKGYALVQIDGLPDDVMIHTEFMNLPARPMVRISLPEILISNAEIAEYLKFELQALSADSIVRVVVQNKDQLSLLSANWLRDLVPESMNIELSVPR